MDETLIDAVAKALYDCGLDCSYRNQARVAVAVCAIPICVPTGRIVGDSDACGDCAPCISGNARVPDAVKRLLDEKDDFRERYSRAMSDIDEQMYPKTEQ